MRLSRSTDQPALSIDECAAYLLTKKYYLCAQQLAERMWEIAVLLTINIGYTRLLFAYLTHLGIDIHQIYDCNQLAMLSGLDRYARRPVDEWEALVQMAEGSLPAQDVALGMAEYVKPTGIGAIGYLMMACPNLREAAEALAHFFALLNTAYGLEVSSQNGELSTRMWPHAGARFPRVERMTLATMCWHSRRLSGRDDLRFDVQLAFPETAQSSMPSYEKAFGGKVTFDQATSCLLYPPGTASLTIETADPEARVALQHGLMARLSDLDEGLLGLPQQVTQRIQTHLQSGSVRIEEVASEIGMSVRTLQSRLDAHGSSFRALLDRTRHALALIHLANPSIPLVEVSGMLGFSSQPSFNRAFLRWTGMSPGEFRKARAASGAVLGNTP